MKTLEVLIADDEAYSLSRLERLLQPYAFVSIQARASDSQQVTEHLDRRDYDLLFLDLQMPGAFGLDIARSLRDR